MTKVKEQLKYCLLLCIVFSTVLSIFFSKSTNNASVSISSTRILFTDIIREGKESGDNTSTSAYQRNDTLPTPLKESPNIRQLILDTVYANVSRRYYPAGVCIQKDLFTSTQEFKYQEHITFVTQTSTRHIKELPLLTARWSGPLSAMVFVRNGGELALATQLLLLLRACHAHVAARLSVGIFFFPSRNWTNGCVPDRSSISKVEWNCWNCGPCLSRLANHPNLQQDPEYYPVNLARNLAKAQVGTEWELIADVELQPSTELANDVQAVIASLSNHEPSVLVIPVFEASSELESMPRRAHDLLPLLDTGMAVPFHNYTSVECHRIPLYKSWLNATRMNPDTPLDYACAASLRTIDPFRYLTAMRVH